ncbi:hypothetical protein AB5J52_21270 [Streptomyces sp. R39]|uniref:Uncharacterized protein n=1 Tax=Streptomyces sp. R39 TaxID=3238631 RepID=A0AB39QPN8_9ACTN
MDGAQAAPTRNTVVRQVRVGGRYAGAEADAGSYGALVFGLLSLPAQGVAALVMSIAGWL